MRGEGFEPDRMQCGSRISSARSLNAWQSGHHHPTGTACCLRCASQARIYALNMCRRRVFAFRETVRQSLGQGGLVHIRSDSCGIGTINFWAVLGVFVRCLVKDTFVLIGLLPLSARSFHYSRGIYEWLFVHREADA